MNNTMKLNVTGMTCQHCVTAVKEAIEGVEGVEKAEVNLSGEVAVTGTPNAEQLIAAVQEEGYGATLV